MSQQTNNIDLSLAVLYGRIDLTFAEGEIKKNLNQIVTFQHVLRFIFEISFFNVDFFTDEQSSERRSE